MELVPAAKTVKGQLSAFKATYLLSDRSLETSVLGRGTRTVQGPQGQQTQTALTPHA